MKQLFFTLIATSGLLYNPVSTMGIATAAKVMTPECQPTDTIDSINDGQVIQPRTPIQLKEVAVTASVGTVKYNGMDYTISNLKGTAMADAGSMLDMLAWAPGISVGPEGAISVFGVDGSPLIYLNGIKLTDKSQIETLSSNMVKSIEVIRRPGAEYPAATSSVIIITTSVPISEILNASLSETARIFRRYSNRNALNLWGAHKNITATASLQYQCNNGRQYATATENIFDKTGQPVRDMTTEEIDNIHGNRWAWFGGLTWSATPANQFQVQYSGNTSSRRRNFENQRTVITQAVSETVDYDSRNKSTPVSHSLIGSFTHDFEQSKLAVTATYNSKSNTSEERVVNRSDDALFQLNNSHYSRSMCTATADYSWKVGKGPSQSSGLYGGRSWSTSNSQYSVTGPEVSKSSVSWAEAYYTFNIHFAKTSLRAGVHGRYESQSYDVTQADEVHRSNASHFNIVPDASVYHRFSKKLAMNLYYKYDYDLPTFSQLNPSMVLSDLLFWNVGNPDLKIPRTHNLALVANLPSLNLVAEYTGYKNYIMEVTSVIDNTDYFLVRPENMSGNYNLQLSASYSIAPMKTMQIYLNGLVRHSHVEYFYQNELLKRNKLMTQLSANVNYRPAKSLSLFLTARYTSPKLFENIMVGYSCNVSFGGNLRLFKSKLNLRLHVDDLLGKSVTPSWSSFSPNLKRHRINRYDTRGVTLTATYTFSIVRNKYDELDDPEDLYRM